jgi:F0F1-type ATP synthase membrane subunit b/b'
VILTVFSKLGRFGAVGGIASFFVTLFPLFAFASEEGGDSPLSGLLWRIFVFAIFAAILYKLLAKRIKNALVSGAENIRKTIDDAESACAAAERDLAEYAAKIDGMTKELDEMKAVARNTAEKEAELILKEAEASAAKYKEHVKKAVDAEVIKAVANLRSEIALLAIEQAEAALAAREDDAEKERYIENAVSKIGA